MSIHVIPCIRTLRLKVKTEAYAWLNAAAVEVNQVWNWANETSYKAARPFAGPARWLSEFDLNNLAAGATEYFEHIGSATIQRVNAEYSTRRRQFKKAKLRWRISRGAKRSLGWIPFKAAQLKRKGKSLRFSGKVFRVFEQELLEGGRWKCGCFAQDRSETGGCVFPLNRPSEPSVAPNDAVGLDLGLKDTAATSDGDKLEAGYAGRSVRIVSERYTTQTCSSCGARTGPIGLEMCAVRTWMCSECGDTHDRDVNAAKNILSAGRLPPSVSGNESSSSVAPTSQAIRRGESRKRPLKNAA